MIRAEDFKPPPCAICGDTDCHCPVPEEANDSEMSEGSSGTMANEALETVFLNALMVGHDGSRVQAAMELNEDHLSKLLPQDVRERCTS